jgi:hypothetical protein
MKAILCAMVLALLAPGILAPDTPEDIDQAWNSAKARQDLGFILYSYYENSVEGDAGSPSEDGSEGFSQDLDSFLGGQGRESDCALVHALWFDMGDGAEGDIVDEIANRGEHMLPIIAFAMQELAMSRDQGGGQDCGVVVRMDQATVRDIYMDCIKEIKGDVSKQSI